MSKALSILPFQLLTWNTVQITHSHLYPNHWAPRYIPSMSLNTECGLVAILCVIFMREKLRRVNQKLDSEEQASSSVSETQQIVPGDDKKRRVPATRPPVRYIT